MKRAMITVCGEFGSRYWVSDLMLTCLAKLASALGQNGCEVIYADSMDNAQMRNPARDIKIEADMAKGNNVDILFVIYKDEARSNNLFAVFDNLRDFLPRRIALVLVDIGNNDAMTGEQKALLSQLGLSRLRGLFFLHGRRGTNSETVKILLRDIALGI